MEGWYLMILTTAIHTQFLAENVTVNAYGTQVTDTVCTLFGKHLTPGDFEAPEVEGSYLNPKAVDIFCPK